MSSDRKVSAASLADRLAEELAQLRALPGLPPSLLAHKAGEIELMIDALRAFSAPAEGRAAIEQDTQS